MDRRPLCPVLICVKERCAGRFAEVRARAGRLNPSNRSRGVPNNSAWLRSLSSPCSEDPRSAQYLYDVLFAFNWHAIVYRMYNALRIRLAPLSPDLLMLKRFSSHSLFLLLDEPQPRKSNGEDHHNNQNGVLCHRSCPELMFVDQDCGSASRPALDLNQKRILLFAFISTWLRLCWRETWSEQLLLIWNSDTRRSKRKLRTLCVRVRLTISRLLI